MKGEDATQRLYEKPRTGADPLFFQILSRAASHGLPNFQRNCLPLAGKRDCNKID